MFLAVQVDRLLEGYFPWKTAGNRKEVESLIKLPEAGVPRLNFAVDLHVPSCVVNVRGCQSVHQQIKILKLLRNVDFLDHNVSWLSEFWVDTILHFKPFGNF